jgi:hypothetical protein
MHTCGGNNAASAPAASPPSVATDGRGETRRCMHGWHIAITVVDGMTAPAADLEE